MFTSLMNEQGREVETAIQPFFYPSPMIWTVGWRLQVHGLKTDALKCLRHRKLEYKEVNTSLSCD